MVAYRKVEKTMPEVDESWWDSVLAEEERYASPNAKQARSEELVKIENVKQDPDWNEVRNLYHQDRIVELQVTGYNRGGVLVEGEGIYGFVPYSHLVEMAAHPEKQNREDELDAYVGRKLRLKVIECAPEDGRIVFSERAALAEPGKRMELFNSLQPGQRISGTVTNITDFGVFIDLGGVEGLIHISELSWGRVAHPSQVVELGQEIEAQVLEISPERCRVALSLKRLLPNPWEKADSDFAVGQIVSAVVTSIVSYGAFARLEFGIEGLIHASEMPLGDGKTVRDLVSEGQEIQARILHVDPVHQRMGLSLNLDWADA
ncbi:MAG: S1 RNA-binding domain-containing protein [Anaerolineales bacterium]|nr:S1 RNA-binding domain-containing protein [Anaerolineales bacterium]